MKDIESKSIMQNNSKHGKRTYHSVNCDNRLRATLTTRYGDTISIFGKHAFSYSIVKEVDGRVVITSFPNRKALAKELKNKYL